MYSVLIAKLSARRPFVAWAEGSNRRVSSFKISSRFAYRYHLLVFLCIYLSLDLICENVFVSCKFKKLSSMGFSRIKLIIFHSMRLFGTSLLSPSVAQLLNVSWSDHTLSMRWKQQQPNKYINLHHQNYCRRAWSCHCMLLLCFTLSR